MWIQTFLQAGGKRSDEVTILCGLPQVTVLGPIVFILYINCMAASLKVIMYGNYVFDPLYLKINQNLVWKLTVITNYQNFINT